VDEITIGVGLGLFWPTSLTLHPNYKRWFSITKEKLAKNTHL